MKYYQVKKEFIGSTIIQKDNRGRVSKFKYLLVPVELYTIAEFKKLVKNNNILISGNGKIYNRPEIAFNIVEQSTKDNHNFFGCRFPNNLETVKVIEPAIEEAKIEYYNKVF